MRRTLFEALMLCFVLTACTKGQLVAVDGPGYRPPFTQPVTKRWNVEMDSSALQENEEVELELALPTEVIRTGKLELTLKPTTLAELGPKRDVWLAPVPNSGRDAVFMKIDGWVEALIPIRGKLLRIHTVRQLKRKTRLQGVLDVVEAPPAYVRCNATVAPHAATTPAFQGACDLTACDDDCGVVDVAILYTAQAACMSQLREEEGTTGDDAESACVDVDASELDPDPIEKEIQLWVDIANAINESSGVNHKYHLVYTGLAEKAVAGSDVDAEMLLAQMSNRRCHPGTTDLSYEVNSVRAATRADLVSLVFYQADAERPMCGYADEFAVGYGDPWNAMMFRSTIEWSCLTDYSLSHELGHNVGADHNPEAPGEGDRGDSAAGHIEPNYRDEAHPNGWMTVMSYRKGACGAGGSGGVGDCCPDCAVAPHYSNPSKLYPEGAPEARATGVAAAGGEGGAGGISGVNGMRERNNAKALNAYAATVSRHRCGTEKGGANVWVADFWEDRPAASNAEPNTFCQNFDVWRSPGIWVRTTKDTEAGPNRYEHEHEHQTPVAGEVNYIYVKVQNTGNEATERPGKVVLYSASTTGLNIEGVWGEPIAESDPVSLPAGSTTVLEFGWEMPNATDYAFLAQWEEDAASSNTLGTGGDSEDIFSDKHLAVLNEHSLDLTGDDPDPILDFRVPADPEYPETYVVLEATALEMAPQQVESWRDLATVTIQIPSELRGQRFPRYRLDRQRDGFEVRVDGSVPFQIIGPIRPVAGATPADNPERNTLRVVVRPTSRLASVRETLGRPLHLELTITQIDPVGAERLSRLRDPTAMNRGLRKQVLGGITYRVRIPPVSETRPTRR